MQSFVSLGGTIRIPVPNEGSCDWGLFNADIVASCDTCAQYYDPRPGYGDNDDGACVYVHKKEKCFPTSWARNQNYDIEKNQRALHANIFS